MNYQLNYDLIFSEYYFGRLVGGIQTTIVLFVLVLSLGLVLAIILVALRSSPFKPLRWLVAAFIEYQRNVPLLVHLLVWYFGIAAVLPKPVSDFANQHGGEFFYGTVTLTLYGGAFISEELRGGLRAIPRAQYETARSLGLSGLQALRLVIVPQAVRNALPPVVSQALSLYKNTSVTAAIGVAEIMYRAREISTETFRVFEAFSIATLVYFTGSMVVLAAGSLLARQLHIPGRERQ
jgi:polar amino acid transport system permease protein